MKRFIIILLLTLLLNIALMPLYSDHLLPGFLDSKFINSSMRVDVRLKNCNDQSLKIKSNNKYQIVNWDKTKNSAVIEDGINSKWQKYDIHAQANHDGELEIYLRGPIKKIQADVCPILVDYRDLKINGEGVFAERRSFWHNDSFRHTVRVKENETVRISFSARRHHFTNGDLTKYYNANFGVMLTIVVATLFFNFFLVYYLTKIFKSWTTQSVQMKRIVPAALSAAMTAWGMYMCQAWYIDPKGDWIIYNFFVLSILGWMTFHYICCALLDIMLRQGSSQPLETRIVKRESLNNTQVREKMANIEFLRIIFTLVILDRHFFDRLEIWTIGHQAVILFFIISGFFLAKTFSPNKSVLQYILNSIIRFCPLILVGACLRCLFVSPVKIEGILSEVFLFSATGICDGRPYNAVSWYISVLFWVSLLYIYLLKTRKRETVNLALAIISFLGIIGLNKRGFTINQFLGDKGDIGYIFEMTLIYGMVLIAVGYFTWLLYEQLRNMVEPTLGRKIFFTIIEAALLFYSVAMMHIEAVSITNFAFLCMVFCALIILFSLKIGYVSRLLERGIWTKLAKYCLAVYLTQAVVMWGIFSWCFKQYNRLLMEHKCLTILSVLAVCCLIGVWAHHIIEKPCARFLKRLFSTSSTHS